MSTYTQQSAPITRDLCSELQTVQCIHDFLTLLSCERSITMYRSICGGNMCDQLTYAFLSSVHFPIQHISPTVFQIVTPPVKNGCIFYAFHSVVVHTNHNNYKNTTRTGKHKSRKFKKGSSPQPQHKQWIPCVSRNVAAEYSPSRVII